MLTSIALKQECNCRIGASLTEGARVQCRLDQFMKFEVQQASLHEGVAMTRPALSRHNGERKSSHTNSFMHTHCSLGMRHGSATQNSSTLVQICIHVYRRLFVTEDHMAGTNACRSTHARMGNCHVIKQVQQLQHSMHSMHSMHSTPT